MFNQRFKGQLLSMVGTWGFNPILLVFSFLDLPKFVRDISRYKTQQKQAGGMPLKFKYLFPVLSDRRAPAGTIGGHYFYQDLWVAQQIHQAKPKAHVDIGSRIEGFITHLLTFREVTVIDIRPLKSPLPNLKFQQGDLTDLHTIKSESIPSLSCLHACEHIGLGRYGDPIDPLGYQKAIKELTRILAPGGTLYFAVPCGQERVEFNAQRIFNPQTILNEFKTLKLQKTAGLLDDGIFQEDINLTTLAQQTFGLGIFVFTKPQS